MVSPGRLQGTYRIFKITDSALWLTGVNKKYAGTPSDQIGWQAFEESASRIASPGIASPELKATAIHVDEPNRRKSVMFSDSESATADEEVDRPYTAPILAEDEIAKDPSGLAHSPAVEPSNLDLEESSSRPSSRPTSLYRATSYELRSTPLEDVEEYEPLFKDDEKQAAKKPAKEETRKQKDHPHRFPSADIWEDAPSSVLYTAEVSTPELFDEQDKPSPAIVPPLRDGETPAQAFARHQEELAEKEARGQKRESFVPAPGTQKPLWAQHQKHLAAEGATTRRPGMGQRFPSRDVWEDAPDSLNLETTVSTPQQQDDDEEAPPSAVDNNKPSIPDRPKPRQASADDKPAVPDRPKPQIPARPAKAGPTSGGLEPADAAAPPPRTKPAVPVRPMGSKIAALQAGFMSDLNRRLQLGPQAPPSHKKEEEEGETAAAEEGEGEKEKAPLLSDARKGRARGPQRRAPAAASPAPAAAKVEEKPAAAATAAVLGFSTAVTLFEIDPDEGTLHTGVVAAEGEMKEKEHVPELVSEGAAAAEVPEVKHAAEEEKGVAVEQEAEHAQVSEPAAVEAKSEEQGAETETKSLATNLAGETLVAEQVKKDEEHDEVEPVKVVEN